MNNSLAQLLISLYCLILFPVKPILPDYFAIDLLFLMAYLNDSWDNVFQPVTSWDPPEFIVAKHLARQQH